MMKLLIGVLLLVSTVHSFLFNCTYSSDKIEDKAHELNFNRKVFAHDYRVMNMQKLTYDPSLEKYAFNYKSCDDLKNATGNGKYRIQATNNNEAFEAIYGYMNKPISGGGYMTFFHEDLHPEQRSFAVCRIDPYCDVRFFVHDGTKKTRQGGDMGEITIYGPKTTFSSHDFRSGPPGYKCRYGHEDGLCLPKGAKKN